MSGQNSMPNPPTRSHDPTTLSGVFAAHMEQAIRAFLGHEARRDPTVSHSHSMRFLFNQTLAGVLHEWNDAHSRTIQLPAEILVHCVSYLPMKDVFISAAICATWRNVILRAPELWKDLDLSDVGTRFLGMFLRRGNGTHSVKLKLMITSQSCMSAIRKHLPAHLHRVRRLEVDDRFGYHEPNWLPDILDRPAPLLETLICRRVLSSTHAGLFTRHAPRLRVLDVSTYDCASPCPAFERVSVLHLRGCQYFEEYPGSRTIWMPPELQELHIYDTYSASFLPLLRPPSHTRVSLHFTDLRRNSSTIIGMISHFLPSALHHIEFRPSCPLLELQEIIHYLRLCDITTPLGLVIQSSYHVFVTLHRSDLSARASLHLNCDPPHGTSEIGPGLVFSHFPFSFGDLEEMTISSAIPWSERNNASAKKPRRPYVFFPPSVEFAKLRTLRILENERADGPDTMFNPFFMRHRGVLRAPSLRCVSLERAPEALRAIAPIPPSMLALFISKHIVFDEDLLPELVVRVSDGVYLEDAEDGGAALEVLQSF
ncbi:hypothetical protein EXIGLDRAFT_830464, partial [Exidia glandulosa HHB12029]